MNEAKFYTQKESRINGRGVWLYLIDCPIGYIYIVEYEDRRLGLNRFIFGADLDKAERKYDAICTKILKGAL